MKDFLKNKVIHPFLFAAFPVLFLYAENVNMVSVQQVWAPLAIVILSSGILFLVSFLPLRNWHKAGLFASSFIVLFVLYRPVFISIQGTSIFNILTITRNRELLPFFLILLTFIGWLLFRSSKPTYKVTYIINVVALLLLAPSLLRISWNSFQFQNHFTPKAHSIAETQISDRLKTPDIYYFIFDGYARQDILKEVFNYDNQLFLNNLKKRGFYIAEKSTSNYCQTYLSVASSLNYNYLPEINGFPGAESDDRGPLITLISESSTRLFLKNFGYKFISFVSGISFTGINNADYYFGPKISFDEFEMALLDATPLPDIIIPFFPRDSYDLHRKTVLFPFEKLPQALNIESPKFTFIHVLSPHPPFIFGSNGEKIQPPRPFAFGDGTHFTELGGTKSEYLSGYRNQLAFLNKQILSAVDSILIKSKTPPIIILQSDHGARLNVDWKDISNTHHQEAFANLSAFYFPDKAPAGLHPEITPVNIFRIILNNYFNANLPLLPEVNNYSSWEKPYQFIDVTKQVRARVKNTLSKLNN